MIVVSLALVVAAAVSLFIGLVVVTDTLAFVFAAIVLCLGSLVLLWMGTRSTAPAHRADAEARARLAQIPGVGPAEQDALLARYGSLEGIRDASVDDIVANVEGLETALASRVKDELA